MTSFSNTSLSPVEDGPHYGNMSNNTWTPNNNGPCTRPEMNFSVYIILVFQLCICIIGLVGNGTVIYLLGFYIKRSPFTMYILNLAVADLGVLLFGILILIFMLLQIYIELLDRILSMLAFCTYGASQFILTAISIDRCVSVLFPIWYRCHRPRHLSSIVCALMWALACLPSGSFAITYNLRYSSLRYLFIVGAVVCLPLVTISTMILFFKVFCISQQPRRGRILAIVLITLLFYLIFAFPLNAIFTVNYFNDFHYFNLIAYGFLCAYLNSSVNPVIYYMVGRKKRGQKRQGLKVILQRAFKEEEEQSEEGGHRSSDITMTPSSWPNASCLASQVLIL